MALKNSYLDYKELGVDSLNVECFYDGTVNWYPFQVCFFTIIMVLLKSVSFLLKSLIRRYIYHGGILA